MTSLKTAALQLAEQGVRVFPCGKDKAPRTANGYYDGTTNREVVESWDWDGMIGAPVPPGVVIIDVDPRNGGSDTLKLLKADGKQLPPTKTVRTKSGGFHYWYAVPEDVVMRGKLGPGVDVKRAGKGYVIVPPSPGYALLSDKQVEAPAWLLEELVVEDAEGSEDGVADGASEPKYFVQFEDGTPYGIAALEREVGRMLRAPEGERNDSLNRAAFALSQLSAGGEISRKRAIKDLVTAAGRMGISMGEARGTIESGWKAGELVPRQARLKVEAVNVESFGAMPERPEAEGEERFWVDWQVDEPPPPFLCHPILPKNAYVLVYGATEASKSMVWNALGAEASRLGYKVSIYSLENPPSTDRDRLRRLSPDPANFRLTNEPLDMNDPRQLEALVEREKEWGTDIILIDTYSHAFNSRSEDGNAKAIEFARRVRYVMHEVDCSVILIDHTGYSQEDEPRDASAKRQQVDCAILMKKAGEWRPGQPARFVMSNKKAARFANPFHVTGEIRDVNNDIRGLELGWLGEKPRWEKP